MVTELEQILIPTESPLPMHASQMDKWIDVYVHRDLTVCGNPGRDMIEGTPVGLMDMPEHVDTAQVEDCPIEGVVSGIYENNISAMFLCPHCCDDPLNLKFSDDGPGQHSYPSEHLPGGLHGYEAVKPELPCLDGHPSDRRVTGRKGVNTGICYAHRVEKKIEFYLP